MTVVINGKLETQVPADERALLLGDGLFETLLVVQGRPMFWDAHWARLTASAAALGFALPRSEAQARADVQLALDAAGLDADLAALRLTLTRGRAARGLWPDAVHDPLLLVSVSAYQPGQQPLRAVTVTQFPRNERSPLCRHKTTSALELVLAQRAARANGAEVALLVNTRGAWVEASYANLFVVLDDELVTPPLAEGLLPGVVRAVLLRRLPVREMALPTTLLPRLQAAFLTNSLMGVRPLAAVDGRLLTCDHPAIVAAHSVWRDALNSRIEA